MYKNQTLLQKVVFVDFLFPYIQVRLPSMDGRVALVPWADMLNHSCEVHRLFSLCYICNLK